MLMASGGRNYMPPPEGLWAAVCVDVVDLGMVDGQWGEKHKCRIVWELSAKMDDGRPFTAQKQYTVSLNEKASLYKDLKSWRGKPFTPEELAGFDVEKVLGAPCQLVITQEEKDGSVYGNITAVMKADPKSKLKASGQYVRVKDRTPKEDSASEPSIEETEAIPF
jgi:hypothetical protein